MPAYLKKEIPNNRLRVKQGSLPLMTSEVLGGGIDVTTLPEAHVCCNKCSGYKFEVWMMLDNYRLELGCVGCNSSYRLLFPMDCPLPDASGRYSCFKHKDKAHIIIHNSGKLCVGCESCKTQIVFDVRPKEQNIILPGEIN